MNTDAPYKKKKVLNLDELLHNETTCSLCLEDLEWNQEWTECMEFWSNSSWNVISKEDFNWWNDRTYRVLNKMTGSWWQYRVRRNDKPKNPWWDEECRELKNDWRKEKERVFKLVFKTEEDWKELHRKWNTYKWCSRN